MGTPSKIWVLDGLRKLLKEREDKACFWRARLPVEQEDDETLAEFRQRQAEDADQKAWADHYAREEDDRANILRQAIRCIATPPQPSAAWRGIDTAPKGGGADLVTDPAWVEPPEILLLFEGGKRCVGRWDAYYGPGGAGESETRGCGWLEALTLEPVTLHIGEPSHWMPLPEAPTLALEDTGSSKGMKS